MSKRESFGVGGAAVILRMTADQVIHLAKRGLLDGRVIATGYRFSRDSLLTFCIIYGVGTDWVRAI